MIQRIQTVFLFLAATVMGLTLLLPMARMLGGTEVFRLTAVGLLSQEGTLVTRTWYIPLLLLVTLHVPVVAIFAFKRRRTQMRMCYVAMGMFLVAQAAMCLSVSSAAHTVSGFEPHAVSLSPVLALPVVAFVLVWLALRAVAKDEKLVRSVDRIR